MMLQTLFKHRFYVKSFKCVFNRNKIIFLNFIIDREKIQMKIFRINAITK